MLGAGIGTVLRRTFAGPRYPWVYVLLLCGVALLWWPDTPFLTVCLYALLLLFLLSRAQFLVGPERDLHIALAVVPALRVLTLSLPEWPVLPLAQRAFVALPLGLTALMTFRILSRNLLGRWRTLVYVPPALLFGAGVGVLFSLLLRPEPLAPDVAAYGGPRGVAALALALIVLAISEESLFRGVLLGAASRLLGPAQGTFLAALAYASLPLGQETWAVVLLFFAFGLGCGWLTHATRSVWSAVALHSAALVTLFLVLPLATQRSGG